METLPPALQALTAYNQFIIYVDKKPIDPLTGWLCNAHDVSAHLNVETALAWVRAVPHYNIGFVLTDNDPFWFIDIDKCLIDNTWSDLAKLLCTTFTGCAIEISHSGAGLHIIGSGEVPVHGCRNDKNGIELYTRSRMISLTGDQITGNVSTIPQVEILPWLVSTYFPPPAILSNDFTWTTEPISRYTGPTNDQELIQKMLPTGNISALWDADENILGDTYPSSSGQSFNHSAADAALCSHLAFWTGKNCERMERLFSMSELGKRDKWIDRENYRYSTIGFAIANCKKTYGENTKTLKLRSGFQLMTPEYQKSYFTGCVYIKNSHRIFTPDGMILKPTTFKATFGGYVFSLDAASEKTTNNAFEVFTESQVISFPKVNYTSFQPELPSGKIFKHEGFDYVNIYIPIETECKQGDASKFVNLINKLFPVEQDKNIILAYMAAIIQYPGVKFTWSPLIQGTEGNGKSFLLTAVSKAIGERYTHKPPGDDLGNNFNAWVSGNLFGAIDEVYVSEKENMISTINSLLTDPRMAITQKGVDQTMGDNRINFMCATNHKVAIKKTRKNRRWCVFYTPQQDEKDLIRDGMDEKYFYELFNWAEQQDGYAIINNFLQSYVIPDTLNPALYCRRAPITSSTDTVIEESRESIEQEIEDMLQEGYPGLMGGWVSSIALRRLLSDRKYRIPYNKRKQLLAELGYIYHPALSEGRTSISNPIDMGRTRLYIKQGHIQAGPGTPADILKRYITAQQKVPVVVDTVVNK